MSLVRQLRTTLRPSPSVSTSRRLCKSDSLGTLPASASRWVTRWTASENIGRTPTRSKSIRTTRSRESRRTFHGVKSPDKPPRMRRVARPLHGIELGADDPSTVSVSQLLFRHLGRQPERLGAGEHNDQYQGPRPSTRWRSSGAPSTDL